MRRTVFAAGLLLATMVQAAPPSDWIRAPGARAERVQEPVFGGQVALYSAGPAGTTEAVVLVHGMGKAAARDWEQVIPALATKYAVYAVDLPGFGHSDKGNHHYSPNNMARALDAVLTPRLQQPFTLIGHSMGGAVTLAYAAAYPKRVRRLVLVDVAGVLQRSVYTEFLARFAAQRAIGYDTPWLEQVVRALQLRADYLPVRGDLLEHAAIRQRVLRGDPSAITAFALVEHDFSRALPGIVAPTLIIWGGNDTIAPLRTGQALAAVIRNARLAVIEGAGHAPQLETPDRFNPLVLDELDGRQPAAQAVALRMAPVEGERVGRCEHQRGKEFTGDYTRLIVSHCQDVTISDARIGYLQTAHSTVRVVNTHVRDGIDAKNTRLEMTASMVSGGLLLAASNVDAAGTTFVQAPAIAINEGSEPVVLRFSISTVSRAGNAPLALHGIVHLPPNETLIR